MLLYPIGPKEIFSLDSKISSIDRFAACHCWHLVRSVSPCQYVDPQLQYRCRAPLGQENVMVWVLTLQLGGGTNAIDWISHGSSESSQSTPLLVTLILVTSFLSSVRCWGLTTGCWHYFMDMKHQTELCRLLIQFFVQVFFKVACLFVSFCCVQWLLVWTKNKYFVQLKIHLSIKLLFVS